MFSFHESHVKRRTFKTTGTRGGRLPWLLAVPAIAVLSLLGWITVLALASALAHIL
jgi:hypothetical protein